MNSNETKKNSVFKRLLCALGFVPEKSKCVPVASSPSQEFVSRTVEKFKRQMQPGGRWRGCNESNCSPSCLLSPIDFDLYVNKSLFLDFDRLSDYAKHLQPEEIGDLKKDLSHLLSTPLGRTSVEELKEYHQKPLGLALKDKFPGLAKKMIEAGIFPDSL